MNLLRRWWTFNLVGALGMLVQLAALFCLNRLLPGHYLVASALALELTLLHNFLWHRRTTWRDRAATEPALRQLGRFHLTNGLVSLAGNLLLMRLLVHGAHLPVLVSNAVAILCCALANFLLGHCWAFRANSPSQLAGNTNAAPCSAFTRTGLLLLLLAAQATAAAAQTGPQPAGESVPPHPAYTPRCQAQAAVLDCAYTNAFVGPSVAFGSTVRPTVTAGVTFGQYFTHAGRHWLTPSPQIELGLIGPIPGGHALDGLAGFQLMFAAKLHQQPRFLFATAGYTRMFVTGNAASYGVGLDLGRLHSGSLLRLELHDYLLFSGPRQHVFGLRLALGALVDD